MARVVDWITAARPLAQANIALPLLLGQALALARADGGSLGWLAYLGLYGVVDQLFIVFANDYADRHTDGRERTPFSGGSGVIVEGRIAPCALRRAAIAMAAALVALSLAVLPSRPLVLVLTVVALGLVQAYSFAPLTLSVRPAGALAQAVGVGGVLPLLGFYAPSGRLDLPTAALAATLLAGLGGHLLTAVPDIDQDARVAKRTLAVALGERGAVLAAVGGLALATAVAITLGDAPSALWLTLVPLSAALVIGLRRRGDARRRRILFALLGGVAHGALLLVWAAALALG